MKRLALWLLPLVLCGAPARYGRVGDFEGSVEVQLQAADEWQPVSRNMPAGELAWFRTGDSSRAEFELDDGCVLHLGANSLVELSDYTRLSTGQRITLVSLDHGIIYFTGSAEGKDSMILSVPGAQMTIHQRTRLRLEARPDWSQIAAAEGQARFSSPTAEFDLTDGQMARIDPAHPSRFFLYQEVTPLDTDRWVDERDQLLASSTSGPHTHGLRYGLADLDANGTWVEAGDLGAVWKPKVNQSWSPYRNGKWQWYDGLGYTWISADSFGWLPYHYGRWAQLPGTGWVWIPGESAIFKPGEVYWLKSAKLVGWGPLASGDQWAPPAIPSLFSNSNTTYANFAQDSHEIDPAGFTLRPKEPLAVAAFVLALPSPALPSSRLEAVRPALRAGSTRVVPAIAGVTFEGQPEAAPDRLPPVQPAQADAAGPAEQPVVISDSPSAADEPPPAPVYVPVYTGIIVVNPPASASHRPATVAGQAKPAPSAKPHEPEPPPKHEPPRLHPEEKDKPGK